MSLQTEYEFTLPRGYVDQQGGVHRNGTMRLATARDELEPLRHPTITGPDDPRLTVLILARVVTSLGDLPMVTSNEIEQLFAADLAYLQDFYGVINFGTQAEYEAFLAAQAGAGPAAGSDEPAIVPGPVVEAEPAMEDADAAADSGAGRSRARIEEIPRDAK